MDSTGVMWQLKRQDDHGNQFIMHKFRSKEEAEERMEYYQCKGHKQTYWVEKSKEE